CFDVICRYERGIEGRHVSEIVCGRSVEEYVARVHLPQQRQGTVKEQLEVLRARRIAEHMSLIFEDVKRLVDCGVAGQAVCQLRHERRFPGGMTSRNRDAHC